jgi:hypothetical protein
VELYLHSPNTPSWRGAELKHRETLPFTAAGGGVSSCFADGRAESVYVQTHWQSE